jgi:type 2 lantibiotic biosynthesis protein LanM
MNAFNERLVVRAATIDELLSDDFEPAPGRKDDAEAASHRLAVWSRHAANGDLALFERRLARDHLTAGDVLARFNSVRRKNGAAQPSWVSDSIWIEQALQSPDGATSRPAIDHAEPLAFERLFSGLADQAESLLWPGIDTKAAGNLAASARIDLRHAFLAELTGLCAPALYERFAKLRKAAGPEGTGTRIYDQFLAGMKTGGFRSLFEDKPVLLRLIAIITRQWIDTSREFMTRLDADLAAIRRDILSPGDGGPVAAIKGDFSDPHNGGRSVRIVTFADGSRAVYKPKDLQLDAAWHELIGRLNHAEPPVELKAVRAIARDGYGWTKFVDHRGTDPDGCKMFFRRAGAWLALLHCFAAADMHQENIIAAGDHPVPIDLETIFHATAVPNASEPEEQAADAARETLANSIMSVGLLPAYGRSSFNDVFAMGGMTSGWTARTVLTWTNINTDAMRPARARQGGETNPNLPHTNGIYAKFANHIEDFISGFAAYATFLSRRSRDTNLGGLFDGFSGVPVRKVIRPTKFYHMLIQRLKAHQSMDDGAAWSAQADFIARLADWEKVADPLWPLQRAERAALVTLNVPHFTAASDASDIGDAEGTSVRTQAPSGLQRARERVRDLDAKEIAWQIEIIRENTNSTLKPAAPVGTIPDAAPTKELFAAEAGKIAGELSRYAFRRGPSAAWVGLDFLGDAEVFQLICLGPDLYNGESGIALFLAAHAAATGANDSRELALAGLASLRKTLKSRNAPRIARALGVGAGTGLGSIVYALSAIAKLLRDDSLQADARAVAGLMTDEVIAADKQLDVIGGSAGAILGLLRLHRDTGSADALHRAVKCGEHLLAQSRIGPQGRRSWVGQGFGARPLNGMSHGAAGFAYALASLAKAAGREDFARAAEECIVFEDESYDAARHNWPDLRGGEPSWPCQWCHGAAGIGLARAATIKRGAMNDAHLAPDIGDAVEAVQRGWQNGLDTLCCGTLGNIEFLCEAGDALDRPNLRELAAQRLAAVLQTAASSGDYRWNSGQRRFNLGLFRGLAGVGYTALRRVEPSLPNILIWD